MPRIALFGTFWLLAIIGLSACISAPENQQQEINPIDIPEVTPNLKIAGIVETDVFRLFPAIRQVNSNTISYEVRRCAFGEEAVPGANFGRPVVSIHSLDETTSKRNDIIMSVVEDSRDYVQTLSAPLLTFLISNESDVNSGEIILSYDESDNGDQYWVPRPFSFSPSFSKFTELTLVGASENSDYAYFFNPALTSRTYFYDQNENLIFTDAGKLGDKNATYEFNEIPPEKILDANILGLCDSEFDYVEIEQNTFPVSTRKIPCKQNFDQIRIDNLQPNESALVSLHYYPMRRINLNMEHTPDPPFQWPVKEQKEAAINIQINAQYSAKKEKLFQIELKFTNREYEYDIYDNVCKPISESS
ncbi:MAG: hypothetical protein Q8P05_06085 [Candidatus Diapherotrites archaeon]|nr:hypothetical protein [Candidatus Diapherotrites archaeon]